MPQQPVISKSTFRGTLVLVFLLIVLFVLPDLIAHYTTEPPIHITFADQPTQDAFRKVSRNTKRADRYQKRERYRRPEAAFDPNDYTLEDWMALGLSEKQAGVILKFGKRGIRSNEDLKRIFVISDELFALIKDSTIYSQRSRPNFESFVAEKNLAAPVKIELNQASMEELLTVKGIGPFFAKQIVKRRDELGGFISTGQLMEVWKMDDEKMGVILPSVSIDPGRVKKININTATVEELKAHPYFNYSVANSIVKIRAQNGSFKSVEGIKKSVLVTDELFQKLRPYLTVD